MRRGLAVAGVSVAGLAIAVGLARRPMKAHWEEGTLPGRWGSWLNSYLNQPTYRAMAAVLELGPEDDLLDVACGWGEFLTVQGATARSVAGIDHSEEKVAFARERLVDRVAAGTAEVVQGDAAVLPWAEERFSAVTCMDAFSFFPAPERVLSEVFRVLRPSGRMVMQIGANFPKGVPTTLKHPGVKQYDDEAEVRDMVEDAGFVDVEFTYVPVGGASRAGNFASRVMMGTDEERIVRAVKPAVVTG